MNDKRVNILQLASWLTAATSNNKGFLLKPKDLNILYFCVFWTYITKYHSSGPIISDEQISIPEQDLIHIVELIFHNTFYSYFNRILDM